MNIEKKAEFFAHEFAKLANTCQENGIDVNGFVANGIYQIAAGLKLFGATKEEARDHWETVLDIVYSQSEESDEEEDEDDDDDR